MAEVIGFVDRLPKSRPFATIPYYNIRVCVGRRDEIVQLSQFDPIVQGLSIICQTLVYS
jgi:hypothetical protein